MKHFKSYIIILLAVTCNYFATAQTVYDWSQDGRVILQFKPEYNIILPLIEKSNDVDISQAEYLTDLIDVYEITRIRHLFPDIDCRKLMNTYEVEFQKIYQIDKIIADIENFPFIEYVEQKALHKHFFTPNDQYFTNQYQWGLFKIQAQQAWDISTGAADIVVAVLDDAILTTHPDLTGKFVPGRDVAEGDNNPNPAGGNHGIHGTHVSGTVGAKTNNSIGVASIGYNTSIMPIKIGRDSDGGLVAGYEGIVWAANNGAHILNMSWGSEYGGAYGQNIVNFAYNKGCILVAAAGNDGVSTMFYPAAYNNVIAVAATRTNDAKASFSQFGTWIDICAPGQDIISTIAPSGYNYASGTSMASPLVAGLLGLMKSVNPFLNQQELTNCLLSSADNINSMNSSYIGQIGAGRINAFKALQCVAATNVTYDAGIISIIAPNRTMCNEPEIEPKVVLKNYGTQILTSVNINYKHDDEPLQTYQWQGSLTQGQTITVDLPVINSEQGLHSFKVFTSNPNNKIDENSGNDTMFVAYRYFQQGLELPFNEDFESNSFETNSWTIINPDNSNTWDIVSVGGTTPGNKASRMKFFDYSITNQRDAMITPPLDLSLYASVELTFEHAYRRRTTASSDSLIIYVSKDCGHTYTRVLTRGESGQGTFATGYTSSSEFSPSQSNDWCMGTIGANCYKINLSPYIGYENVVVKFETFNNNGNNLFIDNINISGEKIDDTPTVQFNSTPSTICINGQITFTDNSIPAINSRLWTFEGGTPATSSQAVQSVTYNQVGKFDVSLQATNLLGSNSVMFENFVTVIEKPAFQTIVQNGSLLNVNVTQDINVNWYKNNLIIPGANKTNYQVTTNGSYKARLTNIHGCFVFTNEVNIDLTNIEHFHEYAVRLYPNPSDDLFIIELSIPISSPFVIEMYDIAGKAVKQVDLPAFQKHIQINTDHLQEGLYFITIKSVDFIRNFKVIIQR